MIHVFKKGKQFKDSKAGGYDCKCINLGEKPKYLSDGWVDSLNGLKTPTKSKSEE